MNSLYRISTEVNLLFILSSWDTDRNNSKMLHVWYLVIFLKVFAVKNMISVHSYLDADHELK